MFRYFNFDKAVDWEIVTEGPRFEQVIRELKDQSLFAWDVETSGLSPWHGARIVGHSFAWQPTGNRRPRAVYFPVRHKPLESEFFNESTNLPLEHVHAALKPILEGSATKIGHNIKYDIHMAFADGIAVSPPYVDTLIGCRLIDETRRSYTLEQCLLQAKVAHDSEWKQALKPQINDRAKRMGMNPTDWVKAYGYQYLTVPVLGRYAAQDAYYEFVLGHWALPQQAPWSSIWQCEMDLVSVLRDMEHVGVPIDTECLHRLRDQERGRMAVFEEKIFALAGTEWELTKDDLTRDILYSRLGYTPPSYTDQQLPSVDDDALFHLERQGIAIAGFIRGWNTSEKVVSTYTSSIIERVDPYNVLHTSFKSLGAKTGRVASSEPNLQNIPIRSEIGRQVRQAFIARPGQIRYCLDYSQIELRMLAHLSQDPLLLKIYHEGLDAHVISAIEAFGTSEVVDGIDMRRIAKILNFGVSFGMTSKGLMGNVNKSLPEGTPPIVENKAQEFIDKFYGKYQGIRRYQQRLWYQIGANLKHEFFNLFGRPRRLGDGFNADAPGWQRRSAERAAVSTDVQGSTADLVKLSMVAVWQYLKAQTSCEAALVLMIHDDLQIDMAVDGSAQCVREVKRLMEKTCQAKLSVPIVADVEFFTTHWADKHKLKGL